MGTLYLTMRFEEGQAKMGTETTARDAKLVEQFDFYLSHQKELVEQHEGKYVVIKDCRVLGAYDSEAEAIRETTREHELGTFIVQKCETGDEDYTQVFHSRVVFA